MTYKDSNSSIVEIANTTPYKDWPDWLKAWDNYKRHTETDVYGVDSNRRMRTIGCEYCGHVWQLPLPYGSDRCPNCGNRCDEAGDILSRIESAKYECSGHNKYKAKPYDNLSMWQRDLSEMSGVQFERAVNDIIDGES